MEILIVIFLIVLDRIESKRQDRELDKQGDADFKRLMDPDDSFSIRDYCLNTWSRK